MSKLINVVYDFNNRPNISNLPAATANGQPVVYEQLNAAIEAIKWKDNARVAGQVNVTIASPGTSIDGATLSVNDRVLLRSQTSNIQNGLYIFNGSTTPMTRSLDANTMTELKGAVVTVSEGTDAGVSYRQTSVTGVLGTDPVVFTSFIPTSPAASTSTSGILKLATQSQVDTGTDTFTAITPATLASWSNRSLRYGTTIGDGSATSILVTHNLGTLDVQPSIYEICGSKREVDCEIQHTSTNSITLLFDQAPASNAYRVVVTA